MHLHYFNVYYDFGDGEKFRTGLLYLFLIKIIGYFKNIYL